MAGVFMALRSPAWTGPVVVTLVVVLLVITVFGFIGVLRLPVPRCQANVVLEQIEVLRDTDPDTVYLNSTDRWTGNITFILANLPRTVSVDFEGDTGHREVLNLGVISGDVGEKDETIDYVFTQRLFERDGPPDGGPLPGDIGVMLSATGSLLCPGTYPLRFPVLFVSLNSGEVETDGWLAFSFIVELDP